MQLTLDRIEHHQGAQALLYPLDLALQPDTVTVLLGATQAGKTTLMRLMAGLDKPSQGKVSVDGRDVTGVPVRERQVAMVYQQFINYPSMTVAQNIASPLRLRRGAGALDRAAIDRRVHELAAQLRIEPFLDRLPAALSGGQQQRVALARALAKDAPLMLLDEPLVNLDYKLREELREELGRLFAAGSSTVVYATTEPTEALLLGGWTAVLDAGELLQYGPTPEVFRRPASIRVARAFSDPPMNLLPARVTPQGLQLSSGLVLPPDPAASLEAAADDATGEVTVGIRASALRLAPRPGDVPMAGQVELAEISGSDTFVHVATAAGELVAQVGGVHLIELGQSLTLHLDPTQVYAFGTDGRLLVAPPMPAART